MDPKIWHNLSYIFLSAGIVFFIITVILSVKFQLFSMIKAELGNRQKKTITDKEEYFAFVENKNKAINNIEEIKATATGSQPQNKAVQPQRTVPHPDDGSDATVLISNSRSKAVQESSDTVVMPGRNVASDAGDFVITDSIVVIHGNPFITERNS